MARDLRARPPARAGGSPPAVPGASPEATLERLSRASDAARGPRSGSRGSRSDIARSGYRPTSLQRGGRVGPDSASDDFRGAEIRHFIYGTESVSRNRSTGQPAAGVVRGDARLAPGAHQAPGRERPRVAADAGEGLPSPANKNTQSLSNSCSGSEYLASSSAIRSSVLSEAIESIVDYPVLLQQFRGRGPAQGG